MTLTNLLTLLGGLALFLHGMQLMSAGLEAAAGSKMKSILEKLTANRFLGVLAGAGITAVIQSSSATTVMVVGFVDSKMMSLRQAMWIIMGANIGTTVTALLISLDMGALAPLFAFVGVVLMVFCKRPRAHHIGSILMGFGVLFIGMDMMSTSMAPLRDSELFINLVSNFSNPLVGILAGAVFTAIIQSSSASVGILQALALSGVIGLPTAVYVLFGQNIGTCVTAVLASLGAGRNAKRTTLLHLSFNVVGTLVFTLLCMLTPLTGMVESLTPGDPVVQIANMHILFNIVTTILLLPAGGALVKLAMRILPDLPEQASGEMRLEYLEICPAGQDRTIAIGGSAIYVNQVCQELDRMMNMARDNVTRGFRAAMEGHSVDMDKTTATEEYVDFLNKEISRYISHTIVEETNQQASDIMAGCFKITGNIERIGDHAMNICEYTVLMADKGIAFSEAARSEVEKMEKVTQSMLDFIMEEWADPAAQLREAERREQEIDDMTDQFRVQQMKRMKTGDCSDEACILFSELLTDFERLGDHALNIAQERSRFLKRKLGKEF